MELSRNQNGGTEIKMAVLTANIWIGFPAFKPGQTAITRFDASGGCWGEDIRNKTKNILNEKDEKKRGDD